MRVRRLSLSAFAVVAVTLCCSLASAESGGKAAAETLFQQATALVSDKQYEAACSKFEASRELDPALGTMLHLADCYERTGKTASAWALFSEAASVARETEQNERQRIAEQRASALEPRLSKLALSPNAVSVSGLVVKLDGRVIPAASFGVALPVDPGTHVIQASAPGKQAWSLSVVAAPGPSSERVELPELRPAANAASSKINVLEPPPPVADDTKHSAQRTLGWLTSGIGVAAAIAGGAFGLVARSKNEESKEHCRSEQPDWCAADGVALRKEAQDFATASNIVMAASGVLVVGGLALVLTAPSSKTSTSLLSVAGTW